MPEKIIRHASFWYVEDGVMHTALRGDAVNVTRKEDLQRGETFGAFATEAELTGGTPLALLAASRAVLPVVEPAPFQAPVPAAAVEPDEPYVDPDDEPTDPAVDPVVVDAPVIEPPTPEKPHSRRR